MKFEEVLPALREGKEIRYTSGDKVYTVHREEVERYQGYLMNIDMLFSNSWEIVEEPKYRWARMYFAEGKDLLLVCTYESATVPSHLNYIGVEWIGDWVKYEVK